MEIEKETVGVIIAAGGSGRRMGGTDKLYRRLDGVPVLARSILPFQRDPRVAAIVIAAREGTAEQCRRDIVEAYGLDKVTAVVSGGAERALSVREALRALPSACGIVLVHDGARPLAEEDLIRRVAEGAARDGAAIPGIPVKDTIKTVATGDTGEQVTGTPARSMLRAVQTPQGFRRDILERVYGLRGAARDEAALRAATDDASLAEAAGYPVAVVEGSERNLKITTPEDLLRAEQILRKNTRMTIQRTGIGYDVHAFAADRRLVLGGVEIPHDRGLAGHSDADVLIHAIMDALLGACALGDIGQHFPDTDPRYKGISSLRLLEHVASLLKDAGWRIVNIDSIVIAQKPKLAPYIDAMRETMAAVLQVEKDCVGVKATTTERLGFTGREEGIAAQAVASVARFQEEE